MLIQADARALPLVDGCVQCCVTSPPYWGLRSYLDGDARQIGLEPTPDAYVQNMVAVFREVRRVLKDDGTLWLNLGDSYASNSCLGRKDADRPNSQDLAAGLRGRQNNIKTVLTSRIDRIPKGLKSKDLIGIPWRVAFALQSDGWYLRQDIIWSKPNPMPESVTDRPTKAHEYIFLLSKRASYYYDAEAIREGYAMSSWTAVSDAAGATTRGQLGIRSGDKGAARAEGAADGTRYGSTSMLNAYGNGGRNKRSVWRVATQPYSGSHFATFPEALIEPCILAGAPIGGLVLDPFIGSGTTGAVASRLGRRWVGCDLGYHELSRERTAQRGLLFGEATA